MVGAGLPLWAQGNTATIRGAVTDEQRFAIGRAGISIDAPDLGLRRRLVAQADGTFEIAGLRPGGYHLRGEAEGFRPKELHVQLEVNQRARVDVTLTAKGIEESIDVSGVRCHAEPHEELTVVAADPPLEFLDLLDDRVAVALRPWHFAVNGVATAGKRCEATQANQQPQGTPTAEWCPHRSHGYPVIRGLPSSPPPRSSSLPARLRGPHA